MRVLNGHTAAIQWLLPVRHYVWSGSYDHTIRIWTVDGNCIKELVGHADVVQCAIKWKHWLWSGSGDNCIRVWNT